MNALMMMVAAHQNGYAGDHHNQGYTMQSAFSVTR